MKFKEWFNLDETRYGGLWARWKAQNPNVPEYILKQMYINHISPGMRTELDPDWSLNKPTQPQQLSPQNNQNLLPKNNNMSNALTAVYQDPQNPLKNVNQTATVGWIPKQMNNLPSDVINQRNMLNGIKWNKKPKIVSVTPLSFEQRIIRTFIGWQFGYNAI